MAKNDPCSISWCDKPQIAKGWCSMHYYRDKKGQDMDAPPKGSEPENGEECSWPGCDHPPKRRRGADGLCTGHYARRLRGAPMDPPIGFKGSRRGRICSVSWCDRPQAWSGLCRAHASRKARGIDLDKPFKTSPGQSPAAQYPKALERAERLENDLERVTARLAAAEAENRELKARLDRMQDEIRGVAMSADTRKERTCLSCGEPFGSDGPGHRICDDCKPSVRHRGGGFEEVAAPR